MTRRERFARWLDRALVQGQTTPTVLGRACGVSRQAVQKWRTGRAFPEARRVSRLAAHLGVRSAWLHRIILADRLARR